MFRLPDLPYSRDSLAPFLTLEQIQFHYEKHHKAYIDNLNKIIENTPIMSSQSLEEIVKTTQGPTFNNAAQAWNHTFYWFNLCPSTEKKSSQDFLQGPGSSLLKAIEKDFGSLAQLREKFIDTGMKTFGSGWAWLCSNETGSLSLASTSNAEVPFKNSSHRPLMVVDVWEHAYYVDYRNARQKYLEMFWDQIQWKFVYENYQTPTLRNLTNSMK